MQGGASYPVLRMLVLELLEALGVCSREVTSQLLARLTPLPLADALPSPSPSPSQSLDSERNGTPGRPSRPANITPGRDVLGLSGSPILRASTLCLVFWLYGLSAHQCASALFMLTALIGPGSST
ncbi:hypothetical protein CSHISOI_02850 [Colletotrichum shisoi]|uniref:Uncharacterized protein n=1 Tax=Colletotrichum shisoi TaxID=2078593 RepID=A0A5Q4BZU2_9PEZI|nr:hypothetical protein CSHISOI_02850 [Colletotrichum shisoi]